MGDLPWEVSLSFWFNLMGIIWYCHMYSCIDWLNIILLKDKSIKVPGVTGGLYRERLGLPI